MKIFIAFMCLFPILAFAQFELLNRTNRTVRQAGTPPRAPCPACEFNATPDATALPTTRPRQGSRPYFNTACRSFIAADGSYGPWGRTIVQYLSNSSMRARFFNDSIPGMETPPSTCPNWSELTDNQKMKFWVWTFASMAQDESSCNTTIANNNPDIPNPNDPPRGLFQLNSLRSNRSWRGPNCGFPDRNTDATNHIRCAMDIMSEVLLGQNGDYRPYVTRNGRRVYLTPDQEEAQNGRRTDGRIFPANSYWQKLRGGRGRGASTGRNIGNLIRQYPPCGATP